MEAGDTRMDDQKEIKISALNSSHNFGSSSNSDALKIINKRLAQTVGRGRIIKPTTVKTQGTEFCAHLGSQNDHSDGIHTNQYSNGCGTMHFSAVENGASKLKNKSKATAKSTSPTRKSDVSPTADSTKAKTPKQHNKKSLVPSSPPKQETSPNRKASKSSVSNDNGNARRYNEPKKEPLPQTDAKKSEVLPSDNDGVDTSDKDSESIGIFVKNYGYEPSFQEAILGEEELNRRRIERLNALREQGRGRGRGVTNRRNRQPNKSKSSDSDQVKYDGANNNSRSHNSSRPPAAGRGFSTHTMPNLHGTRNNVDVKQNGNRGSSDIKEKADFTPQANETAKVPSVTNDHETPSQQSLCVSSSNNTTDLSVPRYSIHYGMQIPIGCKFEAIALHVMSWKDISITNKKNMDELLHLEKLLENCQKNDVNAIVPNFYGIAMYQDETWARVRVKDVDKEKKLCVVEFIDYGKFEVIDEEAIFKLPMRFFRYGRKCRHVAIGNVQGDYKSKENMGFEFTDKFHRALRHQLTKKRFRVEVVFANPSVSEHHLVKIEVQTDGGEWTDLSEVYKDMCDSRDLVALDSGNLVTRDYLQKPITSCQPLTSGAKILGHIVHVDSLNSFYIHRSEDLSTINEIKKRISRVMSCDRTVFNPNLLTSTPYCFYLSEANKCERGFVELVTFEEIYNIRLLDSGRLVSVLPHELFEMAPQVMSFPPMAHKCQVHFKPVVTDECNEKLIERLKGLQSTKPGQRSLIFHILAIKGDNTAVVDIIMDNLSWTKALMAAGDLTDGDYKLYPLTGDAVDMEEETSIWPPSFEKYSSEPFKIKHYGGWNIFFLRPWRLYEQYGDRPYGDIISQAYSDLPRFEEGDKDLKVGCHVCVEWKKGEYLRGVIEKILANKKSVLIFLNDIGRVLQYPTNSLVKASDDIIKLPLIGFLTQLKNVPDDLKVLKGLYVNLMKKVNHSKFTISQCTKPKWSDYFIVKLDLDGANFSDMINQLAKWDWEVYWDAGVRTEKEILKKCLKKDLTPQELFSKWENLAKSGCSVIGRISSYSLESHVVTVTAILDIDSKFENDLKVLKDNLFRYCSNMEPHSVVEPVVRRLYCFYIKPEIVSGAHLTCLYNSVWHRGYCSTPDMMNCLDCNKKVKAPKAMNWSFLEIREFCHNFTEVPLGIVNFVLNVPESLSIEVIEGECKKFFRTNNEVAFTCQSYKGRKEFHDYYLAECSSFWKECRGTV